MAQLVVAAAGAALGGFLAPGIVAFGMTGASIGWMAGSMLGSAFAPTQKGAGPQLSDLSVSTSAYGTPIPYVQGHPRIAGQIVWASTKREIATTTEQGKGGGGSEYTSYTYEVDLLILLTDNEIAGVPRVWKNGELVYSILIDADDATVQASINNGGWSRMTVYKGAADQLPDPDYEAAVGSANAPAYRGRGAVFIKSLQLGSSGQIPNLTFEVASAGSGGVAGSGTTTWLDGPGESALYPGADSYGTSAVFWMEAQQRFAYWQTPRYSGVTTCHSSTDGITWNEALCLNHMEYPEFGKMARNASHYVMAAHGEGYLGPFYSTNGVDWSPCTFSGIGYAASSKGVAFGGSVFLVMANNAGTSYVSTSANGISFALVATIAGSAFGDVIWSGTHFIATGGRRFGYSSNGVTWTTGAFTNEGSWANRLVSFAGIHLTYSNNLSYDNLAISTDHGVSFSLASLPDGMRPVHIWHDGIQFLAMSFDDLGGQKRVYASTDAVNWLFQSFDDPWFELGTMQRPYPAASTAGLSVSVTLDWTLTPKRTWVYSFASADTFDPFSIPLPEVVTKLCTLAGLAPAQFDVTALSAITRPVRSMAISSVSSARTVLDMLAQSYHFEAVLSDKIYFRPRATAPAATLTFNELGVVVDGGNTPDPLPLTQANELEIPAQMALTYSNVDGDYQTDTQYSDRLLTGQESTSAMQVPLGFTASEAKQIVDAMLLDKAVSALTTSVSVGLDRASLEPTDVVLLTGEDGSTYRMRIAKKSESSGVTTLECVADDATVFTQSGATSGGTTSQTTVLPTPTTALELLDVPLLRDADNLPGHYVSVKGSAANWASAGLFDSLDNLTFTPLATIASQSIMGTCTTTLPTWAGGNVFDEVSSVTVNVGTQQLVSVTRDDILASQSTNTALIGAEVLQYRTATLISAGVYTLSGFLRGMRGTASSGHVASERFVALSAGGLRFVPLQAGDLGRVKYYKAASAGQALSAVTSQPMTPVAINLRPFAPVNARANRNAADTAITWTRQTRLSTRIVGTLGINSPLGEVVESYEVEVYTAGHATLKRTLASSTLAVTYTSAHQVADFGSAQAVLYLRIFQISATVGRGAPLTVII